MAATYEARTVGVSIDRDPRDVYTFVSHPPNLPQWASGLSELGTAIEQAGDAWVAQAPDGPVTIRFAAPNPFGVLDHWVRPATGDEVYAPMRVIPNGAGSQMLFTLFRLPTMSDDQFAADAAWVERDLSALKALYGSVMSPCPRWQAHPRITTRRIGRIRMNVLFVAGFGPIAPEMDAAQEFYAGALGLPLGGDATYLSAAELDGTKHFAVWPLSMAAQSCFGTDAWPRDVPAPQGWIEFDVDDVGAATAELEARGYRLLVTNKMEPWGQTVSRLLGPEGLLVGITYTPALRA